MSPAPAAAGAVLVVCGMHVEARLAAGDGVRTLAGGGRADRLAEAIEREIEAGVVAIVSFGIAGALSASLRPGALVVADAVEGPETSYAVDARWREQLLRRLPGARSAPIAGSDVIVADRDAKARLHARGGAVVVDMESHVAARIAARHGLPFAALRAVADPLERTLPPAALVGMRDDGGIDLPAVLWSLTKQPGQLPRLIAIGLDTRRALRSLGDSRRALGRGLGYLDLDQLPVHVV